MTKKFFLKKSRENVLDIKTKLFFKKKKHFRKCFFVYQLFGHFLHDLKKNLIYYSRQENLSKVCAKIWFSERILTDFIRNWNGTEMELKRNWREIFCFFCFLEKPNLQIVRYYSEVNFFEIFFGAHPRAHPLKSQLNFRICCFLS